MPRVVNAKLTDNDTIALNRKFQELGYDTASQLLRDISRSKVYLSLTKGIPFDINYDMLSSLIKDKLRKSIPNSDMDWAGFEPATSRLRSEYYYP